MRRKNTWILGLAAGLFGCMDVGLQDEVRWLDGNSDSDGAPTEESVSAPSPAKPAADSDDETAPVVTAPSCAPKEVALEHACAAIGPVSAAVRLRTDEPAEFVAAEVGGGEMRALSPSWSTEHEVVLSLDGKTEIPLELTDASGNTNRVTLELEPVPGPAVVITEILADPTGPEPAQEFVEIANLGAEAVDLTGWTIDDNGDDNGDELPSGSILPSGQVALIVAPDFDPALADGAPVPKEAMIIRLETSIGTSGLKNSEAETVELKDALGKEVSVFTGDVAPQPGASAGRRDPYLPEGVPGAFELAKTPSPGTL